MLSLRDELHGALERVATTEAVITDLAKKGANKGKKLMTTSQMGAPQPETTRRTARPSPCSCSRAHTRR